MPLDGMVPSDTYFTPTIFVFEKLNQIWESMKWNQIIVF